MPCREQWAKCYTDRYLNFGLRVNSPNELSHRLLKTFLSSDTATLWSPHKAIEQMLEAKQRAYEQAAAKTRMTKRHQIHRQKWMGKLPMKPTIKALELSYDQGLLAGATIPSVTNIDPQPL